MKYLIVILGLGLASTSMAGNYKEVEYCQDGRLIKCIVGPYAHECEDAGRSCTIQRSDTGQTIISQPFEVTGRDSNSVCPRAYPDPNCPPDGYPIEKEQNALGKADTKCREIAFAIFGQYFTSEFYRVSPWTYPASQAIKGLFVCVSGRWR